jgi:hypothetical protein
VVLGQPKAFDGQGYTLSGSSTTATTPAPPPKEASAITYTIKVRTFCAVCRGVCRVCAVVCACRVRVR